jgi:hypothetical protein
MSIVDKMAPPHKCLQKMLILNLNFIYRIKLNKQHSSNQRMSLEVFDT